MLQRTSCFATIVYQSNRFVLLQDFDRVEMLLHISTIRFRIIDNTVSHFSYTPLEMCNIACHPSRHISIDPCVVCRGQIDKHKNEGATYRKTMFGMFAARYLVCTTRSYKDHNRLVYQLHLYKCMGTQLYSRQHLLTELFRARSNAPTGWGRYVASSSFVKNNITESWLLCAWGRVRGNIEVYTRVLHV